MTTTKKPNNSQDKMSPMDNRTVLYYEENEWLLEPVPRGKHPIIVTCDDYDAVSKNAKFGRNINENKTDDSWKEKSTGKTKNKTERHRMNLQGDLVIGAYKEKSTGETKNKTEWNLPNKIGGLDIITCIRPKPKSINYAYLHEELHKRRIKENKE